MTKIKSTPGQRKKLNDCYIGSGLIIWKSAPNEIAETEFYLAKDGTLRDVENAQLILPLRVSYPDGDEWEGLKPTKKPYQPPKLTDLTARYDVLIDKKLLNGLTDAEQAEFDQINEKIDDANAEWYGPVYKRLGGLSDIKRET